MKKKLTIAATEYRYTVTAYALRNLTRIQLVAELKARKIPVPKLKDDMGARLAEYLIDVRQLPVTVTIG